MLISPGDDDPHVFIFPQKFVFSKRHQVANVSVQIQNESTEDMCQDRQFYIRHTTTSKHYDYHKNVLNMNIYRLGSSFLDIASVGQDDLVQLGHEDSYQAALNSLSELERFKFDSINNRYLSD